jgi:hypothetical protein
MSLEKFVVKNNRHIALETSQIIALDFNESLKEIVTHLAGGTTIAVQGKKAAVLWKHFSQDLPELLQIETDEQSS